MGKFLLLLYGLVFFLCSCATNKESNILLKLPGNIVPKAAIMLKTDETVFSFTLFASPKIQSEHIFINSIDSVTVKISNNEKVLFSISMGKPEISGVLIDDGSSTVTLNSIFRYRYINPAFLDKTTSQFVVYTKDGVYYYQIDSKDIVINKLIDKALTLTPFFRKTGNSAYSVGVDAVRQYIVDGEYIPDSQILIVEIMSLDGKLAWNSGNGKNFLQMIMNVKPEIIGEFYKYEIIWDGKDNNGKILNPGKYTINYIIPAKPESYSATMEMEWIN
jgi:hypothetical protein